MSGDLNEEWIVSRFGNICRGTIVFKKYMILTWIKKINKNKSSSFPPVLWVGLYIYKVWNRNGLKTWVPPGKVFVCDLTKPSNPDDFIVQLTLFWNQSKFQTTFLRIHVLSTKNEY